MDDLISRQAAIEALGEMPEVWEEDDDEGRGEQNQWYMDKIAIEALPTAGKKGKWIKGIGETGVTTSLYCDQCGYENRHWYEWNFCPNCGARMKESE